MTLSQCYNIQLQDITVYGSDKSAVLALNILGNSSCKVNKLWNDNRV